jgi:uncharacterized protein YjiS (DUF1127 family)
MSFAHITQHDAGNTRSAFGALFSRIGAVFHDVQDMIGRYRVFRQTYDELSALSDRQLADLGLHRSMITRIAMDASQGVE